MLGRLCINTGHNRDDAKTWKEEETLDGHSDWVRDVTWAPNIGLPKSYLASCSQVRNKLKRKKKKKGKNGSPVQ